VIIHYVGEWTATPFSLMPLMAGRSWPTAVKERKKRRSSGRCPVRFARESADGLARRTMQGGIINREIKKEKTMAGKKDKEEEKNGPRGVFSFSYLHVGSSDFAFCWSWFLWSME